MIITQMFKNLWKYVRCNVQKGDRVIVITDPTVNTDIVSSIVSAVWAAEATPTLITIPTPGLGEDLSPAVAAAILHADLLIAAASRSLSRAAAVQKARNSGVRYFVMAGLTPDNLLNGAVTADFDELTAITAKYAEALTNGETVHVTSAEGMDLTFSIKGRPGFQLDGRMDKATGSAGLPGSEAPTAPLEGTAEGVIVVNGAIHELGMLKEPVRMEVRKGCIVSITGGAEAAQLRNLIETAGDENSYNLAEFSFGTNPKARIFDNVQEFKKRYGTIHMALGNNLNLAGVVRSRTHIDCVILGATVEIDGKAVMENGKPLL